MLVGLWGFLSVNPAHRLCPFSLGFLSFSFLFTGISVYFPIKFRHCKISSPNMPADC